VVEWEAHLRPGPRTGDDIIVGVVLRAIYQDQIAK
jgi:hypothetical protein